MYIATKVVPGLMIEMATGRTTYRARANYRGSTGYFNTATGCPTEARERALLWFETWQRKSRVACDRKDMAHAARLTASLYRPTEQAAKLDFLKRWNAIRGVCAIERMQPSEVTSKFLRSFAIARGDIAGSTAKKDWDTIRPILRMAAEEGWIDRVPTFPKVVINKNPRMPFTRAEYAVLSERADPVLRDLMTFIVLGLFRPHEVLRITVADVKRTDKGMTIHIRRKTGIAKAPVPVRFKTLREAVERRIAAVGEGPLFPYGPAWLPRRFNALMDETGLRLPAGASVRRDSWSLRATGICLEIRRQRRKYGAADYLRIARWAGTSISRIDGHYAAFLG